MYKVKARENKRERRRVKIRSKIVGTSERPRLCVFRSNRYIYAQIINDEQGITLVSAVSKTGEPKSIAAEKVGAEIAKKAFEKSIKQVKFDRSGYLYHGRVKSLVEAARKEGLEL